jgi:O-antigen ligase
VSLPVQPPPADATTFLTLYIILLFGVPARLVVGPLGGAGTPAQIIGVLGMAWWLWHWLARTEEQPFLTTPVRRSMLFFMAAVLASYVVAMLRPISSNELNSTELGLISLVSWLGVLLVATDGIPNRSRLEVALRRLALAGGLMAVLGIAQFATGKPFTDLIQIPGLSSNSVLLSVRDREGFNRPAGTALHPIEFGTALTVLLPICLHFAFHGTTMSTARRWFPVAAIALAIPLSISRSAIVGAIAVLAILMPTWTRAVRRLTLLAIGLVGTGMFLAVPGMLGTITGLFTGISGDSSALSRTDSYALAGEFVARSPLLGRGFLTFLPQYRILDNQYLGLLIDCGLIGMVALVSLFCAGLVVGRRTRSLAVNPDTRSLAQSLTASVAAAAISFAFFDAFSFPLLSGLTFLVLGLTSALYRMTKDRVSEPTEPILSRLQL